jgi:hypothetical protein
MAKSAWPKIVQRLWRGGLGVLKFPRRQTRGKLGKHHASGFFYIDAGVAMDTIMDTLKKCAPTLGREVSAWMPSLIIKPTQQWRQLRSNVHSLVSRKAVTQRMQCCQQDQIHPLAVMPAQTARDVINPGLCLGYRGAEILKGCHVLFPSLFDILRQGGPTYLREIK